MDKKDANTREIEALLKANHELSNTKHFLQDQICNLEINIVFSLTEYPVLFSIHYQN